ncbi:MAG TPA: hypothetical protein VFJ19_20145 [Nocardioidaceae bacterium]|nr:hypothetical protein [Nocardioidaceae bacterium]
MTHSLEPSYSPSDSASSAKPAWRWRLEKQDGAEVPADHVQVEGAGQAFPSQADAESWVGETWRELLDAGVEAVTLFEAEREVYGPMSLSSP